MSAKAAMLLFNAGKISLVRYDFMKVMLLLNSPANSASSLSYLVPNSAICTTEFYNSREIQRGEPSLPPTSALCLCVTNVKQTAAYNTRSHFQIIRIQLTINHKKYYDGRSSWSWCHFHLLSLTLSQIVYFNREVCLEVSNHFASALDQSLQTSSILSQIISICEERRLWLIAGMVGLATLCNGEMMQQEGV